MLKDVGLVVNCGRLRLKKTPNLDSVMISFVTAVEALECESTEVIEELREAIQETVTTWSCKHWRKMKRQERESAKIKR